MKVSRRAFFSALLLTRPTQTKPLEVAVIETFEIDGHTLAVLAHHADELSRERFADWLRSHPKSTVRIRSNAGQETTATVFRVRMCFGRALLLLNESLHIQERDTLRISI
jgi:hypothetical protein